MLRASTTAQHARRTSASDVLPVVNKDADNNANGDSPSSPSSVSGAGEAVSQLTRVLYDDGNDEASEAVLTNETYLWLLVLATAAECITTCFVPDWSMFRGSKVNVSATALNFIGPFLDGVTYGYEDLPRTGAPSIACMQFRSAFLGVFTSFSFMVDHAGDLSTGNLFMGPFYICVTILLACASFHIGRSVVQPLIASRVLSKALRRVVMVATPSKKHPSLLSCVTGFILMTTLAAAFGPKGFVRDPKDPQFIGALRVADGEELFLGIFMSCSAILLSDYICERFKPKVKLDALGKNVSVVDWGCLLCNFGSCVLVCLAYEASKLSPHAIKNNLLVLKFVSSFCGSISCFSAAISHTTRLWQAGDQQGALWNLLLHLVVGLLFVPYLNKQESTRRLSVGTKDLNGVSSIRVLDRSKQPRSKEEVTFSKPISLLTPMGSSRVYVGNLPMDIRTREVEDIFYKYGRIRDIDIKFPSRPPAFAFVDFDDPRDAEDAIDGRNGYDYDGNRLRVEAANASSKRSDPSKPKYPRNVRGTGEFAVDVSRLPSRMSWQDLKDYMRKAGDVVFTSVDGRGHGFVEYSNRSDMKYALDKLDDTAIRFKGDKVYIRVKPARSSSRSRSRSRSRSPRSSKKSRSRKRSYSRSRSRSVSGSRSRSRSPRKSSSKKSRRDKDDEKRSTSRSPSKDRVRDGDDAVADQEEETKESLHDSNGKKSDDAPPSAATDHQTASKPDWTVLKVDDLREKLSARGLDTTGERDELIERLEKSDGATAESESQEQAAEAQQ